MRLQYKGLLLLSLVVLQAAQVKGGELNEEQLKAAEASAENHEFQAEVGRLMDIIINSLYTQKEVFLREVISNAADALDKIRFVSISEPESLGETTELAIKVEFNSEEKSIAIQDTGIGMTKNELISNLGTIAKSGTTQFIEAIKGGNLNLIGQFGVGFYSTFLAGQRVQVISKSNSDDTQWIWESSAANSFTLTPDPRGNTLGRGTRVVIYLKQDAQEFAEENTIKDLIKKYSEFINFPIYLRTFREVTKEVADDDDGEEDDQDDKKDEVEVSDDDDENKEKKQKKTIKEKQAEWIHVNNNKAIWLRPKDEISDEEYKNFFKSLGKSNDDPLDWIHFKAEGEVEFTSLIYVPKRAPSDLFENYYGKATSNLKLYVRRVMITEEFEDLVPRYLNFIKGVIDSDELPLNVNRETLQQLKMLKVISRKIVRKTIEMIKKMADVDEEDEDESEEEEEEESKDDLKEEEKTEEQKQKEKQEKRQKKIEEYNEFWKEFGKNIKLGIIEDSSNRQKLAKLTRWHSSKNVTDLTSFDDYISRAKAGQDNIYFIAGESKENLMKSPVIEGLIKKGYEVLILDDPVDEFAFQHLNEYEKKKLVNVGKGDFKLPEDDDQSRRRFKKLKKIFQPLTDWWRKLCAETVDSVIISQRLVNDPIVVVSSESGHSANMERISKAQAYTSGNNAYSSSKKIVEINPNHPAIKELLERVKDDPDSETEEMAKVLYEAALINSGYMIKDTIDFSKRFYRLYNSALGISRDAPIEEYEVELEDEGDSSGDKNDSDSDDEAPPKKNKNALPDDDDVPRDDL